MTKLPKAAHVDSMMSSRLRTWEKRGVGHDLEAPHKFDTTENLLGCNPCVAKLTSKLRRLQLAEYPEQANEDLVRALADRHSVSPRMVIVGDGILGLVQLVSRAFLNPRDLVAVPWPGFLAYQFAAHLCGARLLRIPLAEHGTIDLRAINGRSPKVVFLTIPHDPTGSLPSSRLLFDVLGRNDGLVIVDEAYADYAKWTLIPQLPRFPNLIILRTFSKVYGLAGCRIGYAVGDPDLLSALKRAQMPYSVNTIGLILARLALGEQRFFKYVIQENERLRDFLTEQLKIRGFHVLESHANFVCAKPPMAKGTFVHRLRVAGFSVNDLTRWGGFSDFVRIAVRKTAVTTLLLQAVDSILEAGSFGDEDVVS